MYHDQGHGPVKVLGLDAGRQRHGRPAGHPHQRRPRHGVRHRRHRRGRSEQPARGAARGRAAVGPLDGERLDRRAPGGVRRAARARRGQPVPARARTAAPPTRSARRPSPVAELVRAGRVRDLRGIGRGIEARLRELVETGEIAELRSWSDELRRAGRARALPRSDGPSGRSTSPARSGVRRPTSSAQAAAAGRLRDVPGIGPKREAQILAALAREGEPRPPRGLLLHRARELSAGSPRRSAARPRATCGAGATRATQLAVVVRGATDAAAARGAVRLAAADRGDDRAGGATRGRAHGRGHPGRARGRARRTRSGPRWCARPARPTYVEALEPLPDAPDEAGVYRARSASRGAPPELREEPPSRASRRRSSSERDIRGDLHVPHDLVGRPRERARDGRARRATAATSTSRSATTRRPSAWSRARRPTRCAARPRRSPPPTSSSRRSASCAGSSATSSPTAALDLPDDVLAELDWVQASVHGGQRVPRGRDDRARRGACATRT